MSRLACRHPSIRTYSKQCKAVEAVDRDSSLALSFYSLNSIHPAQPKQLLSFLTVSLSLPWDILHRRSSLSLFCRTVPIKSWSYHLLFLRFHPRYHHPAMVKHDSSYVSPHPPTYPRNFHSIVSMFNAKWLKSSHSCVVRVKVIKTCEVPIFGGENSF